MRMYSVFNSFLTQEGHWCGKFISSLSICPVDRCTPTAEECAADLADKVMMICLVPCYANLNSVVS